VLQNNDIVDFGVGSYIDNFNVYVVIDHQNLVEKKSFDILSFDNECECCCEV
jgi:hypothetical protein